MKQRISAEQLQELNQEQQERLREWWRPRKGDYVYTLLGDNADLLLIEPNTLQSEIIRYSGLPLLSIGQCIELLTEKDMIHLQSIFAKVSHGILSPDEILDALFDALKQVL